MLRDLARTEKCYFTTKIKWLIWHYALNDSNVSSSPHFIAVHCTRWRPIKDVLFNPIPMSPPLFKTKWHKRLCGFDASVTIEHGQIGQRLKIPHKKIYEGTRTSLMCVRIIGICKYIPFHNFNCRTRDWFSNCCWESLPVLIEERKLYFKSLKSKQPPLTHPISTWAREGLCCVFFREIRFSGSTERI